MLAPSLPRSLGAEQTGITELVKRTRSVKVHAYIIHYLRKQMPLGWGKKEKQERLIGRLDREFRDCARRYGLALGDFPPVQYFKKALSEIRDISKFPKLDKSMVKEMDRVLSDDIAVLLEQCSVKIDTIEGGENDSGDGSGGGGGGGSGGGGGNGGAEGAVAATAAAAAARGAAAEEGVGADGLNAALQRQMQVQRQQMLQEQQEQQAPLASPLQAMQAAMQQQMGGMGGGMVGLSPQQMQQQMQQQMKQMLQQQYEQHQKHLQLSQQVQGSGSSGGGTTPQQHQQQNQPRGRF